VPNLSYLFSARTKTVSDVHNIKKNSPLIPVLLPTYRIHNEMKVHKGKIPNTTPNYSYSEKLILHKLLKKKLN